MGSCRGVVDDHVIGIVTVTGLDHLVCPDEVHCIGRKTVMFHQRMLLNNRFNFFRGFGFRRLGQLFAVLNAPFDEDSQGCRTDDPVSMFRSTVEPGTISASRRHRSTNGGMGFKIVKCSVFTGDFRCSSVAIAASFLVPASIPLHLYCSENEL